MDTIESRMERAASEISHWDGYDYVLINDDLNVCFAKIKQILATERLRRSRQTGLIGFVRDLIAD
jgi:guanylate kinase